MSKISDQLSSAVLERNKLCTKFVKAYKRNLQWNILQTWESWNYIKTLDDDFEPCETLFRSCWQNSSSEADLSFAKETENSSSRPFESKDIEFFDDQELLELNELIHLFLDLSIPYFSYSQIHNLIDFLIYKYELTVRYPERAIINFLQHHDTEYFFKLLSLSTLPKSSNVSYFVTNKDKKLTLHDHEGLSKHVVVDGITKFFGNYKKLAQSVSSVVLERKKYEKNKSYIAFYNVLTLSIIESKGKTLGENEIRFLLNNIIDGIKNAEYLEYYNAQLCSLAALSTKVSLNISTQRTLVTAILEPLLCRIGESDQIPFYLRVALKNSMAIVSILLGHQKERITALPENVLEPFFRIFLSSDVILKDLSAPTTFGRVIDFSRLCSIIFQSSLKIMKTSVDISHASDGLHDIEDESFKYIGCLSNIVRNSNMGAHYSKVFFFNVIDELSKLFSTSYGHGDLLVSYGKSDSGGIIEVYNKKHVAALIILRRILNALNKAHKTEIETLINKYLGGSGLNSIDISLFVSNSVLKHFRPREISISTALPSNQSLLLPLRITRDNIHQILPLYMDYILPYEIRLKIYKLFIESVTGGFFSPTGADDDEYYSCIGHFISITLNYEDLFDLHCSEHEIWKFIPVRYSLVLLVGSVQKILNDMDKKISFDAVFTIDKMGENKYNVDISQLFSNYASGLSCNSNNLKNLSNLLRLILDLIKRSPDDSDFIHESILHFIILLKGVSSGQSAMSEILEICESYLCLKEVAECDLKLLMNFSFHMLKTLQSLVEKKGYGQGINQEVEIVSNERTLLGLSDSCFLINGLVIGYVICTLSNFVCESHVGVIHAISIANIYKVSKLIEVGHFSDSLSNVLLESCRTSLITLSLYLKVFDARSFTNIMLFYHSAFLLNEEGLLDDLAKTLENLKVGIYSSTLIMYCFECCSFFINTYNSKRNIASALGNTCTWFVSNHVDFILENENLVVITDKRAIDVSTDAMIIAEEIFTTSCPANFHSRKFGIYSTGYDHYSGTNRLRCNILLSASDANPFYARGCGFLGYIFRSVSENEPHILLDLFFDFVVNLLPFTLHRDYEIRSEAGKLLKDVSTIYSRNKALYDKSVVKEHTHLLNFRLFENFEFPVGVESSLKNFSKHLVQSNDSFYELSSSFPKFLSNYGKKDIGFLFFLLLRCISVSSHLMFDGSVVKCLLSLLSNAKSVSLFGLDNILLVIVKYIDDQIPSLTMEQNVSFYCFSIKHLISMLSIIIAIVSVGKVFDDEKMTFFGRSICPDILRITKAISSSLESALDNPYGSKLYEQLNPILLMLKDCSLLSLYTMKNGIFWKLSNNERIKLLKSFIGVFDGFGIVNSMLIIDWIFDTKNQKLFPQFLAFLYSLEDVPHKLTEMILLSVMNKINSLQVVEKLFNTTMDAGYDSFSTVSIASKILLKLILGTSFTQTKVQTLVFASTKKLLKFGTDKVKTRGENLDPIHIEVCGYLNLLYSAMYKLVQENHPIESSLVVSLYDYVCIFINSLSSLFGPLVFVAVRGFLKNMIVIFIKCPCDRTVNVGISAVIDAIAKGFEDGNIDLYIKGLFEISYTIFDENNGSLKSAHISWISYSIFVCLTSSNLQSESIHAKILGLIRKDSDLLSIVSNLSQLGMLAALSFSKISPMFDISEMNSNSGIKNLSKDVIFQNVLNIFTFVRMAVESFDAFLLDCSLESFNDHTSSSFKAYTRLSELVNFSVFALSTLENLPYDVVYAKKRKRGINSIKVGMTFDQDICRKISREIGQCITNIFEMNYAHSYTRIPCQAIKLFCNLKVNFDQNMVDGMWIKNAVYDISHFRIVTCYFTSILRFLNKAKRHGKPTLKSKKLSKEFETINSEMSIILFYLVRCGLFKMGGNNDSQIFRFKGEVWVYFINYPPISLLTIQNLMEIISVVIEQTLSDLKNLDNCISIYSDLIHVIKSISLLDNQELFGCMKFDRISTLLASVNSFLVSKSGVDSYSCRLLFLVLLAFQRTFGNILGNEFHKSMASLVFNYKSIVYSGTQQSLNLEKEKINNSSIREICDVIFTDILKYNTEKLLETINQNTSGVINTDGVDYNIMLVLSYYSGAYIKSSSLIKTFLNLDQTDQSTTLERYGKLLIMLTVNLHFNKIKEKYVKVFEKKHAIVLNQYISSFSEFIEEHATKGTSFSDVVSSLGKYFKGQDYLAKHNTIFSSYILKMLNEKSNAVVVFHDLFVSFSLEYAGRVTTKDLFKIIETHTKLLNKNSLNADYDVISSKDIYKVLGDYANSNLFLHVLVVSLRKYGTFGATQYITPRIYQNVNDVLSNALKIARLVKLFGSELNMDNSWIWLNNSVLALLFMQESVKTWNSEKSTIPDLCTNSWTCLIGECISLFEILPIYPENKVLSQHITIVWSDVLEKTLKELIEGCANDERVVKIEACLSYNLARRGHHTKIGILNILNNLWEHSSVHLSATLKNIMPEIGELVDDEAEVVRSYAQCLNEKINSLVSFTD